MLIPHFHFMGDCDKAIKLYEKAFDASLDDIEYTEDNRISHASMKIHRQTVFKR